MLTLSLDVICDVIYCLHHIAVKSAKKQIVFGQLEKRSGV